MYVALLDPTPLTGQEIGVGVLTKWDKLLVMQCEAQVSTPMVKVSVPKEVPTVRGSGGFLEAGSANSVAQGR
jgi:hypothetical protein